MTVSVVLCTYNGSTYLPEQLASIAAQELPPDEVIVCDDCSTDGTLQILQDWASSGPFPVAVSVSPSNLGVIKNFELAIGKASGSIIALADQDDVWHPTKLRLTVQALRANPSLGMVFTDAEVVNESLHPLGYQMWSTRRFRRAEQRLVCQGHAADVLVRRNIVTGATMAFDARFRDLVLPIPQNPIHVHDGWIAFLLAAVAKIGFISQPLMQYRQRAGQVIGAHPPTGLRMLHHASRSNSLVANLEAHRATIAWFEQVRERLIQCADRYPPDPHVLNLIDGKIRHLQARLDMPRSRPARAVFVASQLATLGYHRFSIGVWAAAKDLTA